MSQPQPNPESPFRERPALEDEAAVGILTTGELEVLGRMPWSSNMTFLVDVRAPGAPVIQGVYKPVKGERPLWDFPAGLHRRETAAFELSAALGWDLVPPTVLRDGPLGEGSVQLYVPTDYDDHYFTLREDAAHSRWFQRLCAFDFVINSTDRKAGHILLGNNLKLYAIDNGLSFHDEFKLRTVIWDWAGQTLPANLAQDISKLITQGPPSEVVELLTAAECEALLHRAEVLLASGYFPSDPSGHRHPWPLV